MNISDFIRHSGAIWLISAAVLMSCACATENPDEGSLEPEKPALRLPSKKATLETYQYALNLTPSTRFWVKIDGVD